MSARLRIGAAAALLSGSGVIALGAAIVPAAAAIAKPTSDFNGDGYQDAVIGAPGGMVAGLPDAGLVVVLYGSSSPTSISKRVVISQNTSGVPGNAEAGDRFGESVATGDLNGDGYADLAIGAPREDLAELEDAGHVTVLFGSATGLRRVDTASFTATTTQHCIFGSALATGDVNGNGRAELLVTRPCNNFGHFTIFSVAKGTFQLSAPNEGGNRSFGTYAITTGDVNGDGYADVVSSYSAVGGTPMLAYFPGSASGINYDDSQHETGGVHVAVGHIDRDGRADVVIGDVRAQQAEGPGGQVRVWYGTSGGLDPGRMARFHQDTPGVPGSDESFDQFGSAVAVGDVNGDGYGDVAIGVQREDVGTTVDAGAVVLLKGGAAGLTTSGGQLFSQNTGNIPSAAETGDLMGWMVTLVDRNKDRRSELIVSSIGENRRDPNSQYGDGAVTLLRGIGSGLTTQGSKTFGSGVLGVPSVHAEFGWSLASGPR